MSLVEKIQVMSCPMYPVNVAEASEILRKKLLLQEFGYCVAINAEKINRYLGDADFRKVIDGSIFPYPDGAGATLAARILAKKACEKINMPVLCLEVATEMGSRVFVYGAKPEVHVLAMEAIRRRFPTLIICGSEHGYVDEADAVSALQRANPDLVLIALGSPKQEEFAAKFAPELGAIFVGGGGSLDIMAGVKRRAPDFFVNNGLEWAYRLVQEPWRLRRQLGLFVFVLRLMKYRFRRVKR